MCHLDLLQRTKHPDICSLDATVSELHVLIARPISESKPMKIKSLPLKRIHTVLAYCLGLKYSIGEVRQKIKYFLVERYQSVGFRQRWLIIGREISIGEVRHQWIIIGREISIGEVRHQWIIIGRDISTGVFRQRWLIIVREIAICVFRQRLIIFGREISINVV